MPSAWLDTRGRFTFARRPTTIAHKLNVLRRIYAAAGLRTHNPAVGIRAPRDRRAPEDFQRRGDDWALLVHGKSHDRLIFLRPDVAEALRGYLAARAESSRMPTAIRRGG